jgi:serine/threonine protein kinase
MIFPQAKCNLRTFMDEVERPGFAAEHVVWFFEQLRGLADAVRHLHALKALPALVQFRKGAPVPRREKMAFHNDIKPENILVFEPDDGSLGLMKISDFGCGKVVRQDSNSGALAAERFYGTPEYESPDVVTQNELSQPNDIWALGCVYLELLDWFTVPKSEVQMSFQSQRYTGPGPSNAAFWHRDTDGKFKLKPQVGRKLMDLEKKYCYPKKDLQWLLHIIWFLLDVDMKDRTTAEQLYNDINHITRQAIFDLQKDPDFYINATNYEDGSHLLTAALPTPSWMMDSGSSGYHSAEGPTFFDNYDWDAIRAQQPEFEGHEPYLSPEDHRKVCKLRRERPGYDLGPSRSLDKPWGILNRPVNFR